MPGFSVVIKLRDDLEWQWTRHVRGFLLSRLMVLNGTGAVKPAARQQWFHLQGEKHITRWDLGMADGLVGDELLPYVAVLSCVPRVGWKRDFTTGSSVPYPISHYTSMEWSPGKGYHLHLLMEHKELTAANMRYHQKGMRAAIARLVDCFTAAPGSTAPARANASPFSVVGDASADWTAKRSVAALSGKRVSATDDDEWSRAAVRCLGNITGEDYDDELVSCAYNDQLEMVCPISFKEYPAGDGVEVKVLEWRRRPDDMRPSYINPKEMVKKYFQTKYRCDPWTPLDVPKISCSYWQATMEPNEHGDQILSECDGVEDSSWLKAIQDAEPRATKRPNDTSAADEKGKLPAKSKSKAHWALGELKAACDRHRFHTPEEFMTELSDDWIQWISIPGFLQQSKDVFNILGMQCRGRSQREHVDWFYPNVTCDDVTANPIYKWAVFQGLHPLALCRLLEKWQDRKSGKQNCVALHGPPSTGKSFMMCTYAEFSKRYGMPNSCNENFPFNDCHSVRAICWDEMLLTPKTVESFKTISAGTICRVDRKCKDSQEIPPTPIMVTSNHVPWKICSGIVSDVSQKAALLTRMHYIQVDKVLPADFFTDRVVGADWAELFKWSWQVADLCDVTLTTRPCFEHSEDGKELCPVCGFYTRLDSSFEGSETSSTSAGDPFGDDDFSCAQGDKEWDRLVAEYNTPGVRVPEGLLFDETGLAMPSDETGFPSWVSVDADSSVSSGATTADEIDLVPDTPPSTSGLAGLRYWTLARSAHAGRLLQAASPIYISSDDGDEPARGHVSLDSLFSESLTPEYPECRSVYPAGRPGEEPRLSSLGGGSRGGDSPHQADSGRLECDLEGTLAQEPTPQHLEPGPSSRTD